MCLPTEIRTQVQNLDNVELNYLKQFKEIEIYNGIKIEKITSENYRRFIIYCRWFLQEERY